jgi:hypothetical protein
MWNGHDYNQAYPALTSANIAWGADNAIENRFMVSPFP